MNSLNTHLSGTALNTEDAKWNDIHSLTSASSTRD